MITFTQKGDFSRTFNFLTRVKQLKLNDLSKYGEEGVVALRNSTPVDSGLTASSWSYTITQANGKTSIEWSNSHRVSNVPIAVILQYGHATRNGGWVQGRDYINPAIQPIFDKIADMAWKEVTKI